MVEQPHVPRPHPHGVRDRAAGVGGQVGPAGVAEVAEPLVTWFTGRQLVGQHGEGIVTHDGGRAGDVPGDLTAYGVVAERDVVGLEPADDRAATRPLAGAAAVEPEAAGVRGRDGTEDGDRIACPGSPRNRERSE